MSGAYVGMFARSVPENVGLAQNNEIRKDDVCTFFFAHEKYCVKPKYDFCFCILDESRLDRTSPVSLQC